MVRLPLFGSQSYAFTPVCVLEHLPKVYNTKERPWIKPENATSKEMIEQVAKCPSGALSIKEIV